MAKKKKHKNDLGLSGPTYICDAGVRAGWNIAGDPSLQVARDITIEVVNRPVKNRVGWLLTAHQAMLPPITIR